MIENQVKERRKFYKREAFTLLRFNYTRQTFMSVLFFLICAGIVSVKNALIDLLDLRYSFFSLPIELVFDIVLFAVGIPLFLGIVYTAVKLSEGVNLPAGGMFEYFSSVSGLLNCFRLTYMLAVRMAAFVLPLITAGGLLMYFKPRIGGAFGGDMQGDLAVIAVYLIYFAAVYVCVLMMTRYLPAVYLFVKDPHQDTTKVMERSAAMMKGRKAEGLGYAVSFAGWALVSFFTAGAVAVLFALQYAVLAYASYMGALYAERIGEEMPDMGEYPADGGDAFPAAGKGRTQTSGATKAL
jgi:uncharacterized membrane protein